MNSENPWDGIILSIILFLSALYIVIHLKRMFSTKDVNAGGCGGCKGSSTCGAQSKNIEKKSDE